MVSTPPDSRLRTYHLPLERHYLPISLPTNHFLFLGASITIPIFQHPIDIKSLSIHQSVTYHHKAQPFHLLSHHRPISHLPISPTPPGHLLLICHRLSFSKKFFNVWYSIEVIDLNETNEHELKSMLIGNITNSFSLDSGC